jgi:hypothetical protein
LDRFSSRAAPQPNSRDWRFAESVLREAGVLDGRRGRVSPLGEASPSRRGGSEEEAAAASEAAVEAFSDDDDADLRDAVFGDAAASSSTVSSAVFSAAAAVSGAGRDGARPASARILISGTGDQGQNRVAAAVLHALQGIPCRGLSLASLIAEGEGDARLGVVKCLREPLRRASRSPSVVHLRALETWALEGVETTSAEPVFGVVPSRLWDIFEQTVSASEAGTGEDGCLVILADAGVSFEEMPLRIRAFFKIAAGSGAEASRAHVELRSPDASCRASFLARGAAEIARNAVAPALAAAAAREERARRAAAAAAATTTAATADTTTASSLSGVSRKRSLDAAHPRLETTRILTETLVSKRRAALVLTEKADAARTAARRAVSATAAAVLRSKRFKPATTTRSERGGGPPRKNLFRSVIDAAIAGEYGEPDVFLEALREAAGAFGRFEGFRGKNSRAAGKTVGNGVSLSSRPPPYPYLHAPFERNAAAAAAVDFASAVLTHSREAVLVHRAAAAAETEALEAGRAVSRMEEELESVTRVKDSFVPDAARGSTPTPTPTPTPTRTVREEERFSGDDGHGSRLNDPNDPKVPNDPNDSNDPNSRLMESSGVDPARDPSRSHVDVCAAAAELASVLVTAVHAALERRSVREGNGRVLDPGTGALEKALGTVSSYLARIGKTARSPFDAAGLIRAAREDIETICAACVDEERERARR